MTLKAKFDKFVQSIIDKVTGSGVAQLENLAEGEKRVFDGMPEVARQSAVEGTVLLKNNGILPIKEQTVSVFGRCQHDYFFVGYGSGGDVHAPYNVNLIEGLKNAGIKLNEELVNTYAKWSEENPINHGFWGHWPMNYPEMELTEAIVSQARKSSEVAVLVLGRAAGEDRENKLTKGSYYLTDTERNMLDLICSGFDKVVVIMNCGNIVDMAWTLEYGDKISAIIYAWQCGMESGNALGDIISGKVSPSGKLSDTIAINYEDYPSSANFGNHDFNNYAEDIFVGYRYYETFGDSRVLYPFGFGLSYTDFEFKVNSFDYSDKLTLSVEVKNVGEAAGKEVVQLYVKQPEDKLYKAGRSLVAYAKTNELAPGESQVLELEVKPYDFSSYDEETHSYILEKGEYVFYVGNSVKAELVAGTVELEAQTIEVVNPVCPVVNPFELVNGVKTKAGKSHIKERVLENMPQQIGYSGNKGYKLADVKKGKITLDEFISQLKNNELEALTRGEGFMDSSHGVVGNAGAFCGVIKSLRNKGVPPIITTDGPAGIRIRKYTSLIPCGTALACTFNTQLVEELATVMGKELEYQGSDVLLAPGMNIHRNVLCGRNFEYFSEDPLVSGKTAASFVRGIQHSKGSACPKHFACNNQEVKRTKNDSRLTERALREIYLKGFEICVKEAKPLNIMTSYNKINGVWSHYNYDLVTTVLRGEWGYDGVVMTDWWMQRSPSPEFPNIRDNAYRVRAQVDVYMPGDFSKTCKEYRIDPSLLETVGKPDGLTRGELERTARTVLNLALRLKDFD